MVSRKVIDELYRKFRRAPKKGQQQMIDSLMDTVGEQHQLSIDEGFLIIGSLEPMSPFRRIMLKRIHGVAVFDKSVAIVLPHSILFLNKKDDGINIHFKPNPDSLWDKMKWWFHKE